MYDPSYTDMLRVAFTSEFRRGSLEELVALLSGRNFETREYEESIIESSFSRLDAAVRRFMNEGNFKKFVMTLQSAGFVNASMLRSKNAVNFAYILYLTLKEKKMDATTISKLVRRWFVMSILTGRYSGSFETAFGADMREIERTGAHAALDAAERAQLSDTFWDVGLPQHMDTSGNRGRHFSVFLASQVKANEKGFLSTSITCPILIGGVSHKHHVFPVNHLKKKGLDSSRYNQIANYVVMEESINIAIGDTPPVKYFSDLRTQCKTGAPKYGGIIDIDELCENFRLFQIPSGYAT